jgi:hypothetical protein
MLQAFDAPEAIVSIGARQSTTAPAQSLVLMNSPLARSQATKLAASLGVKTADDLPAAVDRAVQTLYGRSAESSERDELLAFVKAQAVGYPNQDLTLALADLCQSLMCSSEFVYVD